MGARMLLRPDMTQLFWRCFQDCGLGRLPPLKGMVWFPFLTFAGTRKTAGPITGLEIQLLWRLQVHHTREESYSSHPSRTSILKVISLLKRKDPLHQATGQQSRGHLLQEELCQFLQLWPGRRRMIGTTGWISGGGVATQLPARNRG